MKKTYIYLFILSLLGLILLSVFMPSLMPSNNAQFEAKYIPATILVLMMIICPILYILPSIKKHLDKKREEKRIKKLQIQAEYLDKIEEGMNKISDDLDDIGNQINNIDK